ncbi:glutamate ABC transporter substrate-binding protein [Lipingzhangella sp. LS1_29]|uniref:Glutamate ABC transporter substrate-binding protein n=1 Tax=Lipingzhangella rawalii TaxID=2055835 RepID=A0ABU2H8M2_9ACTN|nr:glutamate ABC transporter substrate-binding protein [Lipingzhangella rawalii]MDS1271647.1 glutamate ABC transporter substrate-binding protein [Lipingzhangella rawalii]
MRTRTLALPLAMTLLAATGCTAVAETGSVAGANSLTIGVKYDQPQLGLETGGSFEGFEVDVATYVADRLGVDPDDITWVGLDSADREDAIRNGDVDLVFATYSITQERKADVGFAGPYYVAHQDILVNAENTEVEDVTDLEGTRICQAQGSHSGTRIVEERGIDAELVEEDNFGDCINTALAEGQVQAVSTDDLILAGFLEENPEAFRFVNAPFTDERYGVGIDRDDIAGCEAVNKAITQMYQDGTAAELLQEWFGATDLDLVTSVPQFEGCG